MTRLARGLGLAVTLPLVLFALAWVATANSTSFYLPPLSKIVDVFPQVWTVQRILDDVVPSLTRVVVGYVVAVLLGVTIGVVIGSLPRLRALSEPVLEFLRAIPPPVLVPVLMLFAGIGNTMKVSVIVFGAIWPILLNTVEGVRAVDETLRETCRCYGIRGRARVWHLVVRSASPQIVAGMRQGLSIAIILMVISEMFAASSGLGFTIVQFQRGFAISEMWTGVIILGLMGFALAMLLRLFEWRTLRWYRGLRDAQRGRS
jgi:ABC-type nitrate/sulfonate/bicarbonate transport system permease component